MDAKIDTVITVSGGLRSSIQRTGRGIASLQADFSTVQRDLDTLKSTIDPGFQMVMQRVDNLTEQITRLRVSSVSTANTVDQVVRGPMPSRKRDLLIVRRTYKYAICNVN